MRVVAIVQARSGSARLPGKVLMDLAGRPMISRVLERLARAETVTEVVLATSDHERDDALAELADTGGIRCHRGSETDVLARVHEAAVAAEADVVVRITGDCPLIDPAVVDRVVNELLERRRECDLASNVLRRTYPRGLDTEALWIDALARIERLGHSQDAREHVTWFAYRERPDLFLLHSVEHHEDMSALDWSVDTEDDLEAVRELYSALSLGDRQVAWTEVAAHTRR